MSLVNIKADWSNILKIIYYYSLKRKKLGLPGDATDTK